MALHLEKCLCTSLLVVNLILTPSYTGTLIQEVNISAQAMSCSGLREWNLVFLPAMFREYDEADEACNKYQFHSMASNFQVNPQTEVYNLDNN